MRPPHPHRAARGALLLATSLIGLAACGGDSEDAGRQPAPTTTPATTTPEAIVDWADLGVQQLGEGLTLTDGEGDAPYAVVLRDGAALGIVELNAFPISTIPLLANVPEGDQAEALETYVAESLAAIQEDRTIVCGPGYEMTSRGVSHVQLGDGPATTYGFDGSYAGDPVTERILQWVGVRDDALVIVTVAAYDPESCIGTDGGEFAVAELAKVEDVLSAWILRTDLASAVGVVGLPPDSS